MNKDNKNKVIVLGVPITLYTPEGGIAHIESLIAKERSNLVVLANAYTLNLAYEDEDYKRILQNASLVLRDGAGASWAIKRQGINPGHNFVGTDFIPDFCKATQDKGYKFYLLGDEKGVAEKAGEKLKQKIPSIKIVGYHHGFFDEKESDKIIAGINKVEPEILLIGMGNPRQEKWALANLDKLEVSVIIGVGALFKYLSGEVKRAPKWMLKHNMEWVFRLVTEPKRLWKRYIIGNPKFIWRVLREK